jgi:serine phosphatase RsbU (regulator of sigma subunit)/anti-sigma regulatory factor (Ser/Thr protein kinase)
MGKIWRLITKKDPQDEHHGSPTATVHSVELRTSNSPISQDDPLLNYLLYTQGFIEIEKLDLDSPALELLKQEGVHITVPLISQGELIGLVNLGPRLSEQDYSTDDRRLLNTLVTQAAPALRVAQLAKQQQAEARQLERMEQELRVARVIQETLLPKELPELAGLQVSAHWQPAREVSGDFYDFLEFPDGRLGVVIADVTDKGVPAALVMATTRTIIRATAERIVSPGEVLQRTNDLLNPDIPRNMFVTCLYIVIDPSTGKLWFANAGHNLPYKSTGNGMIELRATGMPLGLLPGMKYEEKEAILEPGESLLLYSDGLVEAHNPNGDMYGFPRLKQFVVEHPVYVDTIGLLVNELVSFTGPTWEQEDDVTLVLINRREATNGEDDTSLSHQTQSRSQINWYLLAEFTVASEPGNERLVMEMVTEAVQNTFLSGGKLERMRTAVAETSMNAIEHGNQYRVELPVIVGVYSSDNSIMIRITDLGGGREIPEAVKPDIEAKLAGLQSPRGWGLFLIESMVDEMHVSSDEQHHTVELIFHDTGERK